MLSYPMDWHLFVPFIVVCVCMFRARKVLETRNMGVEDQLSAQESQLRAVKDAADERDRMYEEVNYKSGLFRFV